MVEICIEAFFRMFLTNENKFELIYRAQMVKKIKLKFWLKFQFKRPRVNHIGYKVCILFQWSYIVLFFFRPN